MGFKVRYNVPIILRRTKALGALVRGKDDKVEQAFVGDGEITLRVMEKRAIEAAEEMGVVPSERNINIIVGELP